MSWDDFRVEKQNGKWVIFVRTSPEDMDDYPIKAGLAAVASRMEFWENQLENIAESVRTAQERERNLIERLEDAYDFLKELHKKGAIDEDDLSEFGFDEIIEE